MDFNRRDKHGRTILHIAAQVGDLPAIKKILAAKADPNVTFKAYGTDHTPLSWANARLENNQIYEVAKTLMGAKADPSRPDVWSEAPLYGAIRQNNFKMVKYYMRNGAKTVIGGTDLRMHPFTPGKIDNEIRRWMYEVIEYNDFQKACEKRDPEQLKHLFHTKFFVNECFTTRYSARTIAVGPEACSDIYTLEEAMLYKNDDVSKIMQLAMKPWSTKTHYLWDPDSRKIAVTLFCIFKTKPKDIIFKIISYALSRLP